MKLIRLNLFYLVIIINFIASGAKIGQGTYTVGWLIVDIILLIIFFVVINLKDEQK